MKKRFLSTVLSLSLISASFCSPVSMRTNLQNATAEDYETTTITVGTSDIMFQTTTTVGTYTSAPFVPSGTLNDFIKNSTTVTTTTTKNPENTTTEETLTIVSKFGYVDGEGFCETFPGGNFKLQISGSENPDPSKYYEDYSWLTFEISDPSVAKISSVQGGGIFVNIQALSIGETVFTVYAPDGRSVSFNIVVIAPVTEATTTAESITDPDTVTTTILTYFNEDGVLVDGLGNVFFNNGTTAVGTPTTTITTECVTDTSTSGTTIATYYDEYGSLVDEFGNLIVINGTSAIGSGTTTAVSTANNITTTSVDNTTTSDDNTTTTTTEPVSSNSDDKLPQTGNSNIFYKVVVGVASAMTITGTAMIVYSKKKDEE